MYLLDTNVVSELRRPKPHGAVLAWLASVDEKDLYLSSFSLGEIQRGIEITRQQDATKAQSLELWLDQLVDAFEVLVLDAVVMREWARMMHRQSNTLSEDAMLAATARVHGLQMITRNTADFEVLGVNCFNPFNFKRA
ncbi:MAG: type II toxin-antitoxin system VapC family toxin [Burkholderiaceae bacterium]|nr:type II toxin-antitoxin system VapC family toxin [Burkholderiaceae bacterium]